MRNCLMICALFLMACDPTIEYVAVRTDVPPELLRTVPLSDKPTDTVRNTILRGVEDRAGLQKANSQIEALAVIVGPSNPHGGASRQHNR